MYAFRQNEKGMDLKMKVDKKKIVILVIVIITVLGSLIVYAYFTARAKKTNNVRLGFNKIEIVEDYKPPLKMEKGIEFTKKPYVINTGDVDCYVRLKVAVSDSRIEKDLTIDYNNTDFIHDETDGYWYYKKELKPNEETEPLFTKVSISENADNLVLEGFDIYVYGESIQTIDEMEADSSKTVEQMVKDVWKKSEK